MDPLWIIFAFGFGFAVKQVGLPPLVGFLIAGFALNLFGVQLSETLTHIADFGVLLLLFTIGLKLKVNNLLKPEIWAGSSLLYAHYHLSLWAFDFWVQPCRFLKIHFLNSGIIFFDSFCLEFFEYHFCR